MTTKTVKQNSNLTPWSHIETLQLPTMSPISSNLGKPFFFLSGLNTGIARKGGGGASTQTV